VAYSIDVLRDENPISMEESVSYVGIGTALRKGIPSTPPVFDFDG